MVQSYRSNSLDPISYSLSIISLNLVEAALKYFWLSIILSYAILIGIATCYAFTGQTDISKVKIRIIEILVFKELKKDNEADFSEKILWKMNYLKPFYFTKKLLLS